MAVNRPSFLYCLVGIVLFTACGTAALAQGQTPETVLLVNGRDGNGQGQPIPLGVYKVSGKQLGSNASVKVAKGYAVRFCANADGSGTCEEFGEGTHNLSTTDFNFIKVSTASTATGTAPAGSSASSSPPLIVYEERNWGGRTQGYGPGMYRSIKGEFGRIADNHAMSIVLAKGYRARFCSDEGFMLRGTGDCEVHEAGRHNLRFATSISFIEVKDLSDTSPDDKDMPVILYEDPVQVGRMQGFDVGVYSASQGGLKKIGNDQASSISVKDGYRAVVCKDEPPAGGDIAPADCEEFGPGKKNLKVRRTASYLKVSKASE